MTKPISNGSSASVGQPVANQPGPGGKNEDVKHRVSWRKIPRRKTTHNIHDLILSYIENSHTNLCPLGQKRDNTNGLFKVSVLAHNASVYLYK